MSGDGWRDIDSAPRDGTWIVLAHQIWDVYPIGKWDDFGYLPDDNDREHPVFGWRLKDEFFLARGASEEGCIVYSDDTWPTHWMPPPTPNKETTR